MREIKFRGKCVETNEWLYGCLVIDYNNTYYITQPLINGHFLKEVYSTTVGQYAGLKDKNKFNLYEGDVLSREGYWYFYVGFEEGCFVMIPCNPVQRVNWDWEVCKQEKLDYWESIGNVHENPKLLEE